MTATYRLETWMTAFVLGTSLTLAACGGSARAPADAPATKSGPGPMAGEPIVRSDESPQPAGASPAPSMRSEAGDGATSQRESKDDKAPSAEPSRPGLGTSWGETRQSRITTTPFRRADPATPFATATLFYNDAQGARAMAGGSNPMTQRRVDVGGGILSLGLKDGDSGRFLNGFESGGRDYAVGEAGQRYVIVVHNDAPSRVEVVVSVDGLDVIDGRPAAFNKRGYLVEGNGTLEIDGFRQSEDAVAAFRFGSVRDSYASRSKTGDARNVGVIGVAVFHEEGTTPAVWRDEIRRRQNANPFPGQFAQPPVR